MIILEENWRSNGSVWFHLSVLVGAGCAGYGLAWATFCRRDLPALSRADPGSLETARSDEPAVVWVRRAAGSDQALACLHFGETDTDLTPLPDPTRRSTTPTSPHFQAQPGERATDLTTLPDPTRRARHRAHPPSSRTICRAPIG